MSLDPDFAAFATAYQAGRHDDALVRIQRLLALHPDSPALYWHHANCLEKLQRYAEIVPVLDALLALKPDYVPAIVKRVQFGAIDDEDFSDEDLSERERARREQAHAARTQQTSLHNEAELRRALALDDRQVEALYLLSNVLRYRENSEALIGEADALLDRAIELAPTRTDLLDARATLLKTRAMRFDDGPDDADTVRTYTGMRYSRRLLEAAVADYEQCRALSSEHRFALRLGMLLHDLGRFDQALECYDAALASLDANDPKRDYIIETRARSERNGAGEREQMADLIESSVSATGPDRSLEDDIAAQALLGTAQAIRAGKPVAEAIDSRLSDDPDTLIATNIAQQILNVAHEPPPQLEAVVASTYPGYQRRFVDRAAREISAVGLRQIGDAEAKGLFRMLGQHVLLRFFADESGETGVACFALKPKWPGLLNFLALWLTRRWKSVEMVECVSQFDNGTHLSTQRENPSPFEYAAPIDIEKLPRATCIGDLVLRHLERVAEYKLAHPQALAMVADDLEGMDARWRAGQQVKRDYRAAIGYVTEAELERMLGAQHARFGDKVRTQLAMLADDLGDSG